jgi:hypothetical protein
LYGAWYCTTEAVAAIAERIQPLRGQTLTNDDFRRLGHLTLALVALALDPAAPLVDLDDPAVLVARGWRPSQVATRRRAVTQRMARRVYEEGVVGMRWWSTLAADWTNLTLFHERALRVVSVAAPPRPLSIELPEVQQAAEDLGVRIAKRPIQ